MIGLNLRLEFPLDFLGSIYKTTLILGSGFYDWLEFKVGISFGFSWFYIQNHFDFG